MFGTIDGRCARLAVVVVLWGLGTPAVADDLDEPRLREGADALEAGRLQDALRWFESALGQSNNGESVRSAAAFDLCLTYYAMGDFGRALNSCYLAYPLRPERSLQMISRIGDRMIEAGIELGDLVLPEPILSWYALDSSDVPGAESGEVRVRPLQTREELLAARAAPVPIDRLDSLHGAAPPLPYREPARDSDYARGFDLALRSGVLFFASDATPFVVGLRGGLVRREHGQPGNALLFADLLLGVDGTAGVAALGAGLSPLESGLGAGAALAIPWGKEDAIQGSLVKGYTIGVDLDLRLWYQRELSLGLGKRFYVRAEAAAGLNLGWLGAFAIEGLGSCNDCTTKDPNPNWPTGHVLLTLDVGFAKRSGQPRYDRYEIFSPLGGRP
ncbi:MAG: hypothetical protein R3B48_15520 [Kofleriaceae bacterium]